MSLREKTISELETIRSSVKGPVGEAIKAYLEGEKRGYTADVFSLSTGKPEDTVLREQRIGAASAVGSHLIDSFLLSLEEELTRKRQNKEL
jgi:hypothetical protein